MTTHLFHLPVCEYCGGPVREQRCDPIDTTEPWDRMRTQVPGPTYNLPCGCIIRAGREREPIAGVDFSDLRETLADGSDCPGCTGDPNDHPYHYAPGRITLTDRTPSGEHTSADTDDVVADIDAAVEEWETLDGARWSPDGSRDSEPVRAPWAGYEPSRDLAERVAHAIVTIDRWRRRIMR